MTTVPLSSAASTATSAACNVLLVCGAAAAGKSTFAKEFAKEFNFASQTESLWFVVEGDFVHNPTAAAADENYVFGRVAEGAPGLHPWSDLKTLLPTSREFCEECDSGETTHDSLMARTNRHIADHIAKLAAAGVTRNFVVPFAWWTRASRLDMARVALPRAFAALKISKDDENDETGTGASKDFTLVEVRTVTVRTAWLECVDSEIKRERIDKRGVTFWKPEVLGCTPAEFDAFEDEVERRERERGLQLELLNLGKEDVEAITVHSSGVGKNLKTPKAGDDSVDIEVDSSGPGRGSGTSTTTQTGSGDSEKEDYVEVRPTYRVVSIKNHGGSVESAVALESEASGKVESCGLRAAEKLFH
eukprot:TRINITY_DN50376_c0_g1_i1.p1 TRINITY_DN50376_c0_g1~~TRINITY_DN50376_c0_g1_i1.p1  ORF type:complete len:361 (-),score=43.72 TRINITY_DN50376_c0_g1_i1:186-1268(-)